MWGGETPPLATSLSTWVRKKFQKKVRTSHLQESHFSLAGSPKKMLALNFLSTLTTNKVCLGAARQNWNYPSTLSTNESWLVEARFDERTSYGLGRAVSQVCFPRLKVPFTLAHRASVGKQHECGHTPLLIATGLNMVITSIKLKYQIYKNGKLHSLLGWMLPKIYIILKKAPNRNFSASNLGQKFVKVYVYLSSRGE